MKMGPYISGIFTRVKNGYWQGTYPAIGEYNCNMSDHYRFFYQWLSNNPEFMELVSRVPRAQLVSLLLLFIDDENILLIADNTSDIIRMWRIVLKTIELSSVSHNLLFDGSLTSGYKTELHEMRKDWDNWLIDKDAQGWTTDLQVAAGTIPNWESDEWALSRQVDNIQNK